MTRLSSESEIISIFQNSIVDTVRMVLKEMISEYNCINCDNEINSESEYVFCSQECLDEYIKDFKDMEKYKEDYDD